MQQRPFGSIGSPADPRKERVTLTVPDLLGRAVTRTPLWQTSQGDSAATLEQIVLADGSALVVKRISPERDAFIRLTHDTGRAGWLWTTG